MGNSERLTNKAIKKMAFTNNEFKKFFRANFDFANNLFETRNFGDFTEEEAWNGASQGIEALNPNTAEWVTIFDSQQ